MDSQPTERPRRLSYPYLRKRLLGAMPPAVHERFRARAVAAAAQLRPDVVFAVKAVWLDAPTARRLADLASLVQYHPDDIANAEHITPGFLEAVPHCDLSITNRVANVDELAALGARSVLRIPFAFDRRIHVPVPAAEQRWDICFVGTRRPERSTWLEQLLARTSLRVRVAGHGWWRDRLPGAETSGEVHGLDMSAVFGASALTLGFVNHQNRDQHTARTFEVPAAGGVLFAERTPEHVERFREGEEALFFDGPDELIEVATSALRDRERIEAIRVAGTAAVWRLGATYEDRARTILDAITTPSSTA
jgi:hypothetical protein